MKILISGANGDIAISIYKIIKKNFTKKTKVDGTDINKEGKGIFYFDRVFELPKASNKSFLSKSLLIYKKYDLIIPTTENEIRVISKNRPYYKNIKFGIHKDGMNRDTEIILVMQR